LLHFDPLSKKISTVNVGDEYGNSTLIELWFGVSLCVFYLTEPSLASLPLVTLQPFLALIMFLGLNFVVDIPVFEQPASSLANRFVARDRHQNRAGSICATAIAALCAATKF
jgi:hypothetical protein